MHLIQLSAPANQNRPADPFAKNARFWCRAIPPFEFVAASLCAGACFSWEGWRAHYESASAPLWKNLAGRILFTPQTIERKKA